MDRAGPGIWILEFLPALQSKYDKVEPEGSAPLSGPDERATLESDGEGFWIHVETAEPADRASGYSGTSREGFWIHFRNSELLDTVPLLHCRYTLTSWPMHAIANVSLDGGSVYYRKYMCIPWSKFRWSRGMVKHARICI